MSLLNILNAGNFSPIPTTYQTGNAKSFFEYNGKTIYFNLDNEDDYRNAYIKCAPLKAVINRRAQMFVNGKWNVLNTNNDNDKRGEYAKSLTTLLQKPNIIQSGKQFKAQQNIYIDLFGYCPVLKVTPVGMPGTIKALWNLPPWLFDVKFTNRQFWNLSEGAADIKSIYQQFYIKWDGKDRELDMDATFLILDNSIGTDNDGNLHLPDSRCKSLEFAISNEIAAKQAANTLITKKGAIGILSNNSGKDQFGRTPLDPTEKKDVQDDFKRYGITGQEWQVIITDAALQWQSMSFPIKDLMLFETMTASMYDICDGMGMYSYIMSNKMSSGATFTNLNEAKKAQYQDFIIPDDEARTEQLSMNIIPEEERAYLQVDYSHVEALQESEKSKAEALEAKGTALATLWDLGLLTRNMMLERLGENKVTNKPEFDKYKFELTPEMANNNTNDKNNDNPAGANLP